MPWTLKINGKIVKPIKIVDHGIYQVDEDRAYHYWWKDDQKDLAEDWVKYEKVWEKAKNIPEQNYEIVYIGDK